MYKKKKKYKKMKMHPALKGIGGAAMGMTVAGVGMGMASDVAGTSAHGIHAQDAIGRMSRSMPMIGGMMGASATLSAVKGLEKAGKPQKRRKR